MLWIKAFHIVFVASWFAALFYLPRLLVNLAEVPAHSTAERDRLLGMGERLYRFANVLMMLALGLGLYLWLGFGIGLKGPGNGWMHAKLTLVILSIGYQHVCKAHLKRFAHMQNPRSGRWYRIFNEVSVLLFTAIVVLVVVKPF